MSKSLLTHSRLAAFRSCPRKHRYAYEMGYRARKQSMALRYGTLFHKCAEAYWRCRKAGGDASAALDAAIAAFDANSWTIQDPYVEVSARALVLAYCVRWSQRDVTVLDVERQFRTPMIHPLGATSEDFEMGGKIDLMLRLEDGRTAVVEHKTSAMDVSPGSDYITRLAIDGQVDQYLLGAASLGYDASVVVYDIAKKTALKPSLATKNPVLKKNGEPRKGTRMLDETPEEYYDRVIADIAADVDGYLRHVELGRTDDQGSSYRFDVWAWGDRILADAGDGASPRNPDACFRYGSACEYWPVCSQRARIDDARLFDLAGAHVELREEE